MPIFGPNIGNMILKHNIPGLIRIIEEEKNKVEIRKAAINGLETLAKQGDDQALAALIDALENSDSHWLSAVISESLLRISGPKALRALAEVDEKKDGEGSLNVAKEELGNSARHQRKEADPSFNSECAQSYEKFISRKFGFSFDYPSGWLNEVIRGIIIIRPSDAKILGFSGENELISSAGIKMMLGERRTDTEDPPRRFFQKSLLVLPNSFQDYSSLWTENYNLSSGEEALLHSFDFMKGKYSFRTIAVLAVKGSRVFNLDGSCLRSDFERFEKIFRRVVMSLRLE